MLPLIWDILVYYELSVIQTSVSIIIHTFVIMCVFLIVCYGVSKLLQIDGLSFAVICMAKHFIQRPAGLGIKPFMWSMIRFLRSWLCLVDRSGRAGHSLPLCTPRDELQWRVTPEVSKCWLWLMVFETSPYKCRNCLELRYYTEVALWNSHSRLLFITLQL